MFATVDEFLRNDSFGENATFVIDVAQEKVQGSEALRETFFNFAPLAGRNNAREQVVREDFLRAFLAAVNGEGDSFVEEGEVRGLLAFPKFFGRQAEKGVVQCLVMFAGQPGSGEHLVVSRVEPVVHKRGGYLKWCWSGRSRHLSFHGQAAE